MLGEALSICAGDEEREEGEEEEEAVIAPLVASLADSHGGTLETGVNNQLIIPT